MLWQKPLAFSPTPSSLDQPITAQPITATGMLRMCVLQSGVAIRETEVLVVRVGEGRWRLNGELGSVG